MALVRQRYKILQADNESSNLGFGTNGQFEVITRYNEFTDYFTMSIFQGGTLLMSEQVIVPRTILNLFHPKCTLAIGGNLWISTGYAPSNRDIGKSVQLIYEFEN